MHLHQDLNIITAIILLSDPSKDFGGGGTYFARNGSGPGVVVAPARRGTVVVHPGALWHGAMPVEEAAGKSKSAAWNHGGSGTSGDRLVLVVFLNVIDRVRGLVFRRETMYPIVGLDRRVRPPWREAQFDSSNITKLRAVLLNGPPKQIRDEIGEVLSMAAATTTAPAVVSGVQQQHDLHQFWCPSTLESLMGWNEMGTRRAWAPASVWDSA